MLAGLRNLLKNSEMPRLVTGPDFSRANKSNKINGALLAGEKLDF